MLKLTKSLIAVSLLCAGTAAAASSPLWTISDADGQVTVTRGDKPLYGAQGTVLQTGDLVSTSKTARAVLVQGGKFVVVDPGKTVRIVMPKEKGAAARIFEYLGGLVGAGTKTRSFNGGQSAAVVKGMGEGLEKGGNGQATSSGGSARVDDPDMWKPVEPQSL